MITDFSLTCLLVILGGALAVLALALGAPTLTHARSPSSDAAAFHVHRVVDHAASIRRPGVIFRRQDGYQDRQIIAQAAHDAR